MLSDRLAEEKAQREAAEEALQLTEQQNKRFGFYVPIRSDAHRLVDTHGGICTFAIHFLFLRCIQNKKEATSAQLLALNDTAVLCIQLLRQPMWLHGYRLQRNLSDLITHNVSL